MNIPSIETLYTTIEQQQRVIKQAHEDIAKLTAERDHWKANHDNRVKAARVLIDRPDLPLERTEAYRQMEKLIAERDAYKKALDSAEDQITDLKETRNRLTAERDAALAEVKSEQNWASFYAQESLSLKSALREAKEAMESCKWYEPSGEHYYDAAKVDRAIATINKVLGEE